jgi:hypothetical protein
MLEAALEASPGLIHLEDFDEIHQIFIGTIFVDPTHR